MTDKINDKTPVEVDYIECPAYQSKLCYLAGVEIEFCKDKSCSYKAMYEQLAQKEQALEKIKQITNIRLVNGLSEIEYIKAFADTMNQILQLAIELSDIAKQALTKEEE